MRKMAKKITGYITKKVADKLHELFKADRKAFEDKWKDLGVFVKYGMVSDEKFYEKAKEFCLLQSNDKQFFTIEEYKEKVKALAKCSQKPARVSNRNSSTGLSPSSGGLRV